MKNNKVKVQRTWETIMFTANEEGYDEEIIELTINHETSSYSISSPCQDELIDFNGCSKGQARLKLMAIEAAVNWLNSDKY